MPARANLWALRTLGVRQVDRAVRGRIADARRASRRLRRARPTRRPHVGTARHVLRRGRRATTCRSPIRTARSLAAAAVDAGERVGVRDARRAARSWSCRARASRRVPSRRWYRAQGWDVINMTQYPEAYLARELGMHYAGIALVTDYDTGVEHDPDVAPVTQEHVFAFFEENLHRMRALLLDLIPRLPVEPSRAAAAPCAARCRDRCSARLTETSAPARRSGRAMTDGPGTRGRGGTGYGHPDPRTARSSLASTAPPLPVGAALPRLPLVTCALRKGDARMRRSPRVLARVVGRGRRRADHRAGRRRRSRRRCTAAARRSAPTSRVVVAARDLELGATGHARRPARSEPRYVDAHPATRCHDVARRRRAGRRSCRCSATTIVFARAPRRGRSHRARRRRPGRSTAPCTSSPKDGFRPPARRDRRRARRVRPDAVTVGRRGTPRSSSRGGARRSTLDDGSAGDGESDVAGSGVTLLVTEAEARVVAFAARVGDLTLAVAPPESACCGP